MKIPKAIALFLVAGLSMVATGSVVPPLAYGSPAPADGTPLESLPVTSKSGVTVLTPQAPGLYSNSRINHGLQFVLSGNSSVYNNCTLIGGSISFELDGKYSSLSGTFYYDDRATRSPDMSITIVNDIGQTVTLWNKHVGTGGQLSFNVPLGKAQSLAIQETTQADLCESPPYNGVFPSFTLMVDMVATLQTPGTAQKPLNYVKPLYPLSKAVIPANTAVAFVWQPFPGATDYAFHIWMVKQQGTVVLTPANRTALAVTVLGKTSYLFNDSGYLPGNYQYDVQPLDKYGNALGPATVPIQITITP